MSRSRSVFWASCFLASSWCLLARSVFCTSCFFASNLRAAYACDSESGAAGAVFAPRRAAREHAAGVTPANLHGTRGFGPGPSSGRSSGPSASWADGLQNAVGTIAKVTNALRLHVLIQMRFRRKHEACRTCSKSDTSPAVITITNLRSPESTSTQVAGVAEKRAPPQRGRRGARSAACAAPATPVQRDGTKRSKCHSVNRFRENRRPTSA